MDGKIYVTITAIVAISAIEITALLTATDGATLSLVIGVLAGLGGFKLKEALVR